MILQIFCRISELLSRQIGLVIILFSVLAYACPELFDGIPAYTSVFLAVIMFGMGLTISLRDFEAVFRQPRALLAGVTAQFVVMPVLAFALAKGFDLPADLAVGFILVGCSPGGTASNVITYLARGDVALSVAMTVASTLLAPIMTPLLVYWLAGSWVEVSLWAMVLSVVKIVLLPVLVGLFLRRYASTWVEKVVGFCPLVSVAGIVLIVSGIIAVNAGKIAESGLLVFFLVFLHCGAGLALGWGAARLLGMTYDRCTAISIEVGLQNSGLAVALAAANFSLNPLATLPGAIFSAWQNIMGSVFASVRRKGRKALQ